MFHQKQQMMSKINWLLLGIFLPCFSWSQAHDLPLRVWNSIGLRAPFGGPLVLDINHQFGFDAQPWELKFTQSTANLEWNVGKQLDLAGGVVMTSPLRDNEETTLRKFRYYLAADWNNKSGIWRYSNGLKFEAYDRFETKYNYRVVYSFFIRTKSNLILPKLQFTPFLSTNLFYNIGGSAITAYDPEGNKLGRFVPEGLHRARIRAGFSIKPVDFFKLTFSGMFQKEFNTPWDIRQHRSINMINPLSGNISRRFQDYLVAGVSAKVYLPEWKGRNKEKREKKNRQPHEETYRAHFN